MGDRAALGWAMAGEAVLVLVGPRSRPGPNGSALRPVPGPGMILVVRYQTSPVGPFTEMAVIEPVRRGVRVGMGVTRRVINDERAGRDGLSRWGVSREVGVIRWLRERSCVTVVWEEEDLVLSAEASRRSIPLLVPLSLLHPRPGEPLRAPVQVRGVLRSARVRVSAPAGGNFSALSGPHRGGLVAAPQIQMDVAGGRFDWRRVVALLAPSAPGAPAGPLPG